MRVVFDCRMETLYPLAKEGFSGGSQTYVKAIIKGLSRKHIVHVIAPDQEMDEQKGPNEYWWPPDYHPTRFDTAVQQMHINSKPDYDAAALILMTSCVDPNLGPDNCWADKVDAYPVFSQTHKDLLLRCRPSVPADRVYITGLGVNLDDYKKLLPKVPGRILYANDPARGLFYVLDIFDLVKKQVPHATLHVAYNFNQQLEWRMWEHSHMAQMLLECKKRIDSTPGVVNLGGISRKAIIQEQLECQVHCYPSDPPGLGTQTHGITQMECAAAGAALVLSDIEAFPEVFSAGATILPVIGQYLPDIERRITAQDYADVVVELMTNPDKWEKESKRAMTMAKKYSWAKVVTTWEEMIAKLMREVAIA